MQSVPPTRSGVVSRGVSASGSASSAAEGVNEHDNIKVTAICKPTRTMHVRQERSQRRPIAKGALVVRRMARQSRRAITV